MKKLSYLIFLGAILLIAGGCGVKGDPVAPATPAEMGRGRPVYRSEDESVNPLLRPRPQERTVEPSDDTEDSDSEE